MSAPERGSIEQIYLSAGEVFKKRFGAGPESVSYTIVY